VSEEVNRNTAIQLSAPYTDVDRQNCTSQTDRRTDHSIVPIADHIACSVTIGWIRN